jgi:protein TonB
VTGPSSSRPIFDRYALPLPRRREGPAAALSFVAHVVIAALVLWRGAALFVPGGGGGGSGPRGGGGGGGRPAVRWFALPAPSTPQAEDVPAAPAVTVPTLAVPAPEMVKIDVTPTMAAVAPAPPAPVGMGNGTTGGPGQGPGSGGGQGTGTGTGVGPDSGSGSGGDASDIFPASPRWAVLPPRGAPREARGRRYEVRFWVTAEGKVTRVEVTPPIKDSDYRREFTERMMGYLFNPATTRDGRRVDFIASATVIP